MRAPSLIALVLLSACSVQAPFDEEPAASVEQALGEPILTDAGFVFPSWEERVIYVLTNRARTDPMKQQAECTPGGYKACPWPEASDGGCYTAQPPLVWDLGLSRAARFHATYLSKGGIKLGHDNCCTLKNDIATSGCDGDPACACVAGTQAATCATGCSGATSSPSQRIGQFTSGYSGEIAHQFYVDPVDIFHGWIDEQLISPPPLTCVSNGNNGHRHLILKSGGPRIGAGHHRTATASCNSPYWVEDFGGGAVTIPRIPGAVHYPKAGTATTQFKFWSNWFHAGGGTPTRSAVVVNGNCRPMALEFGTTQNGSYKYQGTIPTGCQSYYFLFVDSAGTRITYPTVGSMTVSSGTACTNDYSATQVPADCESGTGGGAGGGGGTSGTGGGTGGGTSGTGGGTSGTGGGTSGTGGAGGGTTGVGGGSGAGGGTTGAGGGTTGAGGGTIGAGGGTTGAGGGGSGAGGGKSGAGGGTSLTDGGTSGAGGGTSGTGGGSGAAGGCGCNTGTSEFVFPLLAFGLVLSRRRQATARVAS